MNRLRRVTAPMETGVDELASGTSMPGRVQMTATRAMRLRSQDPPADPVLDQMASDVNMDENGNVLAATPNTEGHAPRTGRRLTINNDLRKKRAKGKQIEIKFPQQFKKVCGKHARLFKSEISIIIRSIPLQVKNWKEMDQRHPGTTADVWRKLKVLSLICYYLHAYLSMNLMDSNIIPPVWEVQGKFPELLEQDKDCAMRQVESQYNNWRYRLHQVYRKNKRRPEFVSPEGCQWLIRNLWMDADFQKWSNQNSLNRGKQEMGSKVGTKSIAQIVYELRDPETDEWPTAMQVWRATYQKPDGTWSIPSGEETMTKLQEVAESHQEEIFAAPVPLVEHFALVLGRKANHSRGVGIRAVNRVAEERIILQAQIDVQLLLEHVPRLLSSVHKLWKVNYQKWLNLMHTCKKSSSPNVLNSMPCGKLKAEKLQD